MKTQTSKISHRQMFIIRNESAALSRKHHLYQSSPQPPIQFIIHGQSLVPTKFKSQNKPTPKEIKLKQTLKAIKYKLQSLKIEQSQIKKQVIQQSQTFKSHLQQIKSAQELNINTIHQYFNEQNKFFQEDISRLKQQIQLINYQVQFLQ
ncbi:unnamed protein product [Paramecium primaurelia]|uniref:Uncharacterized protein n=1 Tax=Paramecium primaurelia TaxID=5886 RepID=A0A8S1KX62_PARPR|nr:unnamed protein product [Paramecium primaurelia]